MKNAILLIVLLSGQGSDPAAVGASPALTATYDSVRPPATLALRNDLSRILEQAHMRGPGTGLLVVSLDRGDTLFAQNAEDTFAPASNLKIFTTAAALHYLGKSFRFNTFLLANGPLRDGVLEGDLVLYGTGDPSLSERFGSRIMEAFADTLVARGIHEVRGDVVGDASYFGGAGTGRGWNPDYANATYAAPASALSYAENVGLLEIEAVSGGRPIVRLVPGGDGIAVVNQLTSVGTGRSSVSLARNGFEGPLTVRGRVSSRSGIWRRWVPVADPPLFAAAALREALSSRGISVSGGIRAVQDSADSPVHGSSLFAPPNATGSPVLQVLAIHTSPPLIDIIEVINRKSQNFMAEQVLRTLGRMVVANGSAEGGTAALDRFVHDVLRLDSTSFTAFDGSGLSPLNRTTPAAAVRLLTFAARAPFWNAWLGTLPEAGNANGLRRMYRTAAEGRLWAKTGTIRNVSALSGYVRTAGGELLAFSILNNAAPSAGRAKQIEDRIGARLAEFDRTLDADRAHPAPLEHR